MVLMLNVPQLVGLLGLAATAGCCLGFILFEMRKGASK